MKEGGGTGGARLSQPQHVRWHETHGISCAHLAILALRVDTRAPGRLHSKVLNDAAHFIVAAGEEKFQSARVVPEQQAHLQPGPAFENIFPQAPDGNPAVSVRMAETIRDRLKRRFNPREIRPAQTFERGLKTRGQEYGGFSHA